MKLHKDKVIPDFIVRYGVERLPMMDNKGELVLDKVDGKPVASPFFRLELVVPTKKDYENRFFLRRCMSVRDLGPVYPSHPEYEAAFKEYARKNVLIMKLWRDPETRRWVSAKFTPEEYMDLVRRAEADGRVLQYRKPKDPAGSAGKVWASRTGNAVMLGDVQYKERLGVDASKMSARERVARVPILHANPVPFGIPPVIKVLNKEMGGIAWVSKRYAQQEGINRGDKLWPAKASAEIMSDGMELQAGTDMVMPTDTIKFKEHLEDPGMLSELMGYLPELSAKNRSSKEKDKVPRLALDTMQWLYPEIMPLFGEQHVQDKLAYARKVVEGRATLEEVLKLGEFTKPDGTIGYPSGFTFLQKGQPLSERLVREDVFKSVGTFVRKALCMNVAGKYGVVMPTRGETRKRLVFLPPWMLPFWVETDTDAEHVVGVDSDWVIGCLGKDYDGDIGVELVIDKLMKRLGLEGDVFPDWTKDEDKAWALKSITLPIKSKEEDPRSVHQVMVDGLKGYNLIGVATNMAMIVLDTLRQQGTSRRELMAVYLKLMSGEVQQYVDALKYVPGGLYKPRLRDWESKGGRPYKGLASKYGAKAEVAEKIQPYFKAVRAMDVDLLSALPEDPTLKGSFYYELASLFRGWKPVPLIDVSKVAEKVLDKVMPMSDTLDGLRKRSFKMRKNNLEARLKDLTEGNYPAAGTPELQRALLAVSWKNNDTSLALALEKKLGVTLFQLATELGIPTGEDLSGRGEQVEEETDVVGPSEPCC